MVAIFFFLKKSLNHNLFFLEGGFKWWLNDKFIGNSTCATFLKNNNNNKKNILLTFTIS